MVNRESSRINDMKYTYELEFRQQDFPLTYIIKEYIGTELNQWFFIYQFNAKKTGNESFLRTKKWLIENHPEMLI